MGIRKAANKKSLRARDDQVLQVVPLTEVSDCGHPLVFWTEHKTKPCLVDLRVFAEGPSAESEKRLWKSAFAGRPDLIYEMLPSIKDQLLPLAKKSVHQYLMAFRANWRLLDEFEKVSPYLPKASSTLHLSELYCQYAYDSGMDRLTFGNFLLLVNRTRLALSARPLLWALRHYRRPLRHLPPEWQTDLLRIELKHRWFATLDRWELAGRLREMGKPVVELEDDPVLHAKQCHLLRQYQLFDEVAASTKKARPSGEDLFRAFPGFYDARFSAIDPLRGSFPDAEDIQTAFHLCLATTGWNAATLVDIDITTDFLSAHPRDHNRYILRGTKARARGAEQLSQGLFKTQGGAGAILLRLR